MIINRRSHWPTMRTAAATLLFGFIVILAPPIVKAANPEIADNELGITSRACADNFCTDKDSLDLWLSLEYYCHYDEVYQGTGDGPVSSATAETIIQAPSRRALQDETNSPQATSRRRRLTSTSLSLISYIAALTLSRMTTATFSAVLGVVGILLGYRVGNRVWGGEGHGESSQAGSGSNKYKINKQIDNRDSGSKVKTFMWGMGGTGIGGTGTGGRRGMEGSGRVRGGRDDVNSMGSSYGTYPPLGPDYEYSDYDDTGTGGMEATGCVGVEEIGDDEHESEEDSDHTALLYSHQSAARLRGVFESRVIAASRLSSDIPELPVTKR